ncbi:MAG: lysophospholipid acyltransferase family protein [Desulfobacterales bacterium]|nr:lysophospholipid acyltransferase family protein [Desulfobacterales bacterium]
MKLDTRRALASEPLQWFLYRFICVYSWTFRLTVENENPWLNHLAAGGSVVLCAWHQQFFSGIRHFRNYRTFNPCIMISQSRDGDIIAGVARRCGWHPVRGSSSKGGKAALTEVIGQLQQMKLAAHIVDGPQGPMGTVKAGTIRLAQATNASLVPFSVTAKNAWHFKSWDRFFVPKPFSRVVLRFGEMIAVDPTPNAAAFEAQRLQIEEAMRPSLVW